MVFRMLGYSLNRIISTLVLIIAVANAGAQDPSTPVPAKNSEKAKATNLEKYGCENPLQNK